MTCTLFIRSGNKKVTLVNNLETYHIDPAQFAHKCQVGEQFLESTSRTFPCKMEPLDLLAGGVVSGYFSTPGPPQEVWHRGRHSGRLVKSQVLLVMSSFAATLWLATF